ncbi:hypothetical protein SAMN04487996_12292 [Dyadobacter soli]|uniref:Uncharacterized protein n=1 Tax=Dyadobacter soli TaxID=659014 RepID=A0A1G7WLG1_9BACT|nr:hypothetical protein [Dyadobacter soli]SDG72773.1 hypothetical protein SAMN04487996_12292 [Dyadobacter soli]
MSRHDESIGRMPNPSQFYLEWNSEKSSFCYYSTEEQGRIPFDLPFRFLALKFMNTITGWDSNARKQIYSNEISDTRMEHFRVAYRDGSTIATGLYSDIKDDLVAVGGRFTRSIYAMTPKGAIANIKLTGGQMFNFGEIEKYGNRWQDEWIQVASFETKQNRENKDYTIPVFTFGGTIQPNDSIKADTAYGIIKAYFNSKSASPAPRPVAPRAQYAPAAAAIPSSLASSSDDDDLPF